LESAHGGGPSATTFKLCRVSKGFKNAIFSFYREELLPVSKKKYHDDAKLMAQEKALFAKFAAT